MLDGGCFYPPSEPAKWAELIRAWARHANERHPNVAANWLWELWNEPDLGYWKGTFEDYATLYDHTESALHEVLPNAALGGPAVAGAGSAFFKQFLKHCATGTNAVTGNPGTRLDLVSFHAKGGVTALADRIQLDLGNQLRLHRTGFQTVAGFSQFKQTPIYITEADPDGCAACPVSSVPADAYRNSTAYGAYELSMMKHSLELGSELGVNLQGVLTWAFTFPGTPYFAGYRTLATNGIQLPVLSAFQLLGRLSGTRVPLSSSAALALGDVLESGVRGAPEIDGIATRDGASIQALVWNYHDDIVTVPPANVHLSIKLPADFGSHARLSHLRVDESHGDAYTVWVSQGMPASPTPAQITALQQAMKPSPLVPERTVALTADGLVSIDFELPRFGVSLVTLQPAPDGNDGGAGGSTGQAPRGGGCACRLARPGSSNRAAYCAVLIAICAVSVRRCRRERSAFLMTD
jgi:xylan 1,4-beta-xylosidase